MKTSRCLLRLVAAFTLLITFFMLRESLLISISVGPLFGNRYAIIWNLLTVAMALIAIGSLLFWVFVKRGRCWLQVIEQFSYRFRWLGLAVLMLAIVGIYVLVYIEQPDRLTAPLPRFWLLWMLSIFSAFVAKTWLKPPSLFWAFMLSLMFWGGVFIIYSFVPQVNPYPFSLGWSEGSRFYNASTFVAQAVYGRWLPLPVLHPTRYLMQAVPFMVGDLPVWVHRLWQMVLWLVCTALGVWLLVRRLRMGAGWKVALWGMFGFLFLFQGPVYYHLMICTYPLLAWFSARRPGRSLLLVLLASVWAGLSRLNWYPVPGVLAAMLYLLEVTMQRESGKDGAWHWLRYLAWPAVWAVSGTGLAFAISKGYEHLSGNSPEVFGSAAESPLLWNRLWPNTTYSLGVLQAALLAILPLMLVMIYLLYKRYQVGVRWHWLRLFGLGAILFVFLAGGIVVSVKVGGGSNLHNMDAFLFFQLVMGCYLLCDRFEPDNKTKTVFNPGKFLVLFLILTSVIWPVHEGRPYALPASEVTQKELADLQTLLDAANRADGRVLFISERQLLTFDQVQVSDFEPDYEKVFLMEMAMAGNPFYLERFYDDLQNQRFALIVAEPLNANYQDERYAFSEENNLWVERVEIPILQYYQLKETLNPNMSIYEPKQ